jgi:predicted CoA-substrate-specific enzyme activase
MIGCGIDSGSRTIKLVLYEKKKNRVLASVLMDSQLDKEEPVRELFDRALKQARCGRKDITKIIATGYGREGIKFADETITEITCHARGSRYFIPEARTIIEIGGQDSKVTKLYPDGKIRDFAMNDRCAAGTGRFLEVVAKLLNVDILEMGKTASRSKNPAKINSTCVVFAESEIIGLLSKKTPRGEIIAGVQNSIVSRVMGLAGRNIESPAVFTGGVALVDGMASRLEKKSGVKIRIPMQPQFTGALGAAILAVEGN